MPSLTDPMPSALRVNARWERLGRSRVPALLVHPNWNAGQPLPGVIWMHGRTVNKELDPGRYLRWMRAGLATCAVDLPGHGERFDAALQAPERSLEVVLRMRDEIDDIVAELLRREILDPQRSALGGMSAGGMAAILRLCSPHPFACASVEATSGSWRHQRHRAMFEGRDEGDIDHLDPIANLGSWREIPFQAIHARHDEWMSFEGQAGFIEALRERYADPDLIEFVVYDRTGAPWEHAGFGKLASDAKNRQRDFLVKNLTLA